MLEAVVMERCLELHATANKGNACCISTVLQNALEYNTSKLPTRVLEVWAVLSRMTMQDPWLSCWERSVTVTGEVFGMHSGVTRRCTWNRLDIRCLLASK